MLHISWEIQHDCTIALWVKKLELNLSKKFRTSTESRVLVLYITHTHPYQYSVFRFYHPKAHLESISCSLFTMPPRGARLQQAYVEVNSEEEDFARQIATLGDGDRSFCQEDDSESVHEVDLAGSHHGYLQPTMPSQLPQGSTDYAPSQHYYHTQVSCSLLRMIFDSGLRHLICSGVSKSFRTSKTHCCTESTAPTLPACYASGWHATACTS